jgi:subtilisin-like proprotein convertase family protein
MKKLLLIFTVLIAFINISLGQIFSSSGSTTIVSNSTETCNSIVVSGLAVSINGTFGVRQVCVTLSSACMKDIDMFLVAPDGTRIEMSTDNGGASDGLNNVCFRMDASANGSIANIPKTNGTTHTGNWMPEGDLYAANNGQNPNGTWSLCVRDDAGGGACTSNGTITSWNIDFGPPYPPAISVQDCNGAIPVCQSTYSETNTYPGSGYKNPEISSTSNCLVENEKNSVWYVFTVETGGNMGFQIAPKSTLSTFDYDWALFNITTNGCNGITGVPADGDPVSPQVSCSYSTAGGSTGTSSAGTGGAVGCTLDAPANNSSNACATGSNQNSLIAVTAGQTYALLISNFTGGGSGYDINFNAPGNTASIFDQTPPSYSAITGTVACGSNTVTFTLTEPVQCSSLSGTEYTVTGPSGYSSTATAVGNGCFGASTTNSITLTLATPLPTNTNGPFIITAGNGSDFATVNDNCGNEQVLGQTISFITACPLPIELLSFNAKLEEDKVFTYWVTSSEINNDFFTVEKSSNVVDFEPVATIKAAGNSTSNKSYYLIDEYPLFGISYYRLKQTDNNGNYAYYNIVAVKNMNTPIRVSTNLVENSLLINYQSAANNQIVIEIYDTMGKILYTEKSTGSEGSNEKIIDISSLSEGIYIVAVKNGEQVKKAKIVKYLK